MVFVLKVVEPYFSFQILSKSAYGFRLYSEASRWFRGVGEEMEEEPISNDSYKSSIVKGPIRKSIVYSS